MSLFPKRLVPWLNALFIVPLIVVCWGAVVVSMAFVKNFSGLLACVLLSSSQPQCALTYRSARIFLGMTEVCFRPPFGLNVWFAGEAKLHLVVRSPGCCQVSPPICVYGTLVHSRLVELRHFRRWRPSQVCQVSILDPLGFMLTFL